MQRLFTIKKYNSILKKSSNTEKGSNDRSSVASSIRNRPTLVNRETACIEEFIKNNKAPKKENETSVQLEKRKTKIKKEKDALKAGKTIKTKGLKISNKQEKEFMRFLKEYKELTNIDFLDVNYLEYYIKLYNHCNKSDKLPIITLLKVDTIEKGELLKSYLNIITKINFK